MFWFHLSSWPGRGPDPGSDKVMVKNGSGNNGNRLGSSMIFNDFQKGSSGSNACLRAGRQCLQQGLLRGRSHYLSSKELCCGCRSYSDQGLIPPCLCFFFIIAVVKCNICIEEAIFFSRGSCEGTAGLLQDCSLLAIWHVWVFVDREDLTNVRFQKPQSQDRANERGEQWWHPTPHVHSRSGWSHLITCFSHNIIWAAYPPICFKQAVLWIRFQS